MVGCFLVGFFLFAGPLWAREQATEVPTDPKKWAESLPELKLAAPYRLMVFDKLRKKGPRYLSAKKLKVNNDLIASPAMIRSTLLTGEMPHHMSQPVAAETTEDWAKRLLSIGPGNLVAVLDKKAWMFYSQKTKGLLSKTVKTRPRKDFFAGLKQALGYDGYVLHQKKDLYLVYCLNGCPRKDAQALIIGKSEADMFARNKVGKALMQAIATDGPYGVFKAVLNQQQASYPVGTKLVIEN